MFAAADSHVAVLEGFSCSSRSCSCFKLISWSVNCSDRGARGDFLLLPVLQQGEAVELSQWLLQNQVPLVVIWDCSSAGKGNLGGPGRSMMGSQDLKCQWKKTKVLLGVSLGLVALCSKGWGTS